jgi:hypothetical protein
VSRRQLLVVGLLAAIAVSSLAIAFRYWHARHAPSAVRPPNVESRIGSPVPAAQPSAASSPVSTASPAALPVSLMIDTVPFTTQAPFENWDRAHEEYCEAAVAYMVGQYLSGDRRLHIPPAEADAAMGTIVAWERATFSGEINLSLDEMARVGDRFYNLDARIVPLRYDAIQRSLASGLPVVIPLMTHGGPRGSKIYPTYGSANVYHTMVLVGYDAAQQVVYVNDPGLREGMQLKYAWSTLSAAVNAQSVVHSDPVGKVPWEQGEVMLIFQPRHS